MPPPQPSFEIRSSHAADALVVEVAGEIDMASSPDLVKAIEGTADSTRRVIVDLSEVTFLDSSALNALVHCQKDLAGRDIVLRLVSPADRLVRRVFEITQLTGTLGVVESRDDALA